MGLKEGILGFHEDFSWSWMWQCFMWSSKATTGNRVCRLICGFPKMRVSFLCPRIRLQNFGALIARWLGGRTYGPGAACYMSSSPYEGWT